MSKKPLHHKLTEDPLFDVTRVSSATDCTGLVVAMPMTEDEAHNLAELENIHPIFPQNDVK